MSSDNHSYAAAISTQLMIAALVFLFMVVIFVFFLYIYTKHYMGSGPRRRRRRSTVRFVFSPLPRRGLDAGILTSLPTRPFKAADFHGGLECSVCLSVVSEGEEVRSLPECGHGFHVQCIDVWFRSNTTCPLCRVVVEGVSSSRTPSSPSGGRRGGDDIEHGAGGEGSSQSPKTPTC